MKKIKLQRKSAKFEIEFPDGAKYKYEYFEPTTRQIDKDIGIEGTKERLTHSKEVLQESLKSKTDGAVDKLIEYQIENGNIYEFKRELDAELGKLHKKA